MSKGYVYVLSNIGMPGLLKIGRSQNDPKDRAMQLYTTGVPFPFEIEFVFYTDYCEEVEQSVHAEFSSNRFNDSREFFKLSKESVIQFLLNSHMELDGMYMAGGQHQQVLEWFDDIAGFNNMHASDVLGAIEHIDRDVVLEAAKKCQATREANKQTEAQGFVYE